MFTRLSCSPFRQCRSGAPKCAGPATATHRLRHRGMVLRPVDAPSSTRYRVHFLVWYERHEEMSVAIAREKAIKRWRRAWKSKLVEDNNPYWSDLAATLAL